MYPPRRSGSEQAFVTSEILSLVNDNGIVIIGARNGYWRSEEAMEFLQGFDGCGVELRSFQEVKLTQHDYRNGFPIDSLPSNSAVTDPAIMDPTAPGGENDTYWLAVLKRCKLADPGFIPKISKYKPDKFK